MKDPPQRMRLKHNAENTIQLTGGRSEHQQSPTG